MAVPAGSQLGRSQKCRVPRKWLFRTATSAARNLFECSFHVFAFVYVATSGDIGDPRLVSYCCHL